MINKEKLQMVITAYKKSFLKHWGDEKYKWEAIKHFQQHWDVSDQDFATMMETALEKTNNLLASSYFYPRQMILNFANEDAEAVRSMFINLYNETKDLETRVTDFQLAAEEIREQFGAEKWNKHFQNTNAISTYLWLRFPDKYYIYKYSEYLDFSKEIESSYIPKRKKSGEIMIGGFRFYDEVCEVLQQDSELKKMLDEVLTESCHSDSLLRTMTIDVGYFVSNYYKESKKQDNTDWFPVEYNPGFTVEDWIELLNDSDVFNRNSLEIMKRIKDYGEMATCSQLSTKYGESKNFYNSGSSALARRIFKKTGCAVMEKDNEDSKWWPILYIGKRADKEIDGNYIWKLREELIEALDKVDLSDIKLYAEEEDGDNTQNYWWLNANPKIWSFSDIRVGEEKNYTLYNDNGNKRRIFQNFLDAKVGDMIIGYESYPVKQVVALARVTQEADGEKLYFEKIEGFSNPIDYLTLKNCLELESMEYFISPQGSLFKLTKGEYEFIMDIVRESNPISKSDRTIEPFTIKDFLSQVYMTKDKFDTLVSLLRNKKNLILQGAPGVGKTFTAKLLAYAMMEEKDDSRIEFIQFHQNYSYEDFIMGYKPEEEGFKLTNGIFFQFCQKAANHPDKKYFFIIDEINRGNMSKIFGELLILIEKDYRGTKATLAYSGTSFSVPDNLYIIGMMNTADRSLAMIDYALRRRFSFFEMEPGFTSDGFKAYQESLQNETFNTLIDRIIEINKEITLDDSLGAGFRIGHSYFCGQKYCTEEWMKEVVYHDIIPLLQEYWFDDKKKLQRYENLLSGVFNDA